jgi:hypothetical protein
VRHQERIARELQERLGNDARVVGEGVHWSVEVTRGQRKCEANCFWYDEPSGLMLGMNPGNARSALRPTYPQRSGAEYLVQFHDERRRIAGGRTQDSHAAVGAIREWLEGNSIADVELAWPFVDATRRRMRELLAIVSPSCEDVARCEIDCYLAYELWVYGRGRSCQLHPAADGVVTASFRIGHAQIAFGDVTTDPGRAISRWVHGATLSELTNLGVNCERHADVLEAGDAARWHWLHVRDRIQDPNDVLADSRVVIERLAERELPTRFFSFSSLNSFCFSASSHYPWVNDGLPAITPPKKDGGESEVSRTIARIETALAACPIAPFFGSGIWLTVDKLDSALASSGSSLRAELRQRRESFDAAVVCEGRHCRVDDDLRSATFHDTSDVFLRVAFQRRTDTVAAIRSWLEDRATPDEIGTLAGVKNVHQRSCEPD